MYKCNICGKFFDEPIEPGIGYYEKLCPECEGDYFEEAKHCRICDKPTTNEFCDNCHNVLKEALKYLQMILKCDSESLKDLIAEYYGF